MSVPSSIADISTTAASNSPSGSEAIGTSLDDYMRSIQAIIKQESSRGSDITAASSITIPNAGSYFVVTGNTGIVTLVDSWHGRTVALKFSGTPVLTHSSGLILPGSANITAAAGDVFVVSNESTGVWRVVAYQPASGYVKPSALGSAAYLTAGTSANNVVQLDGSAKLPAVDGSQLTNLPSSGAAIVSSARNVKCTITSASATATVTADEIVVETALGGTAKQLASYSQAVDLSTTGAGGMDTGSAPVSGFVSLYAIAKTDGTKNILACNVTTSSGSIYAGANMPSGYTFSALIGVIPTNGSSQFLPGVLRDRTWSGQAVVSIFAAQNSQSSLTSQSVSVAVPAAARFVDVIMSKVLQSNTSFSVAADGSGSGIKVAMGNSSSGSVSLPGGVGTSYFASSFTDVPIITSQTIYWSEGSSTSSTCSMFVSGYTV